MAIKTKSTKGKVEAEAEVEVETAPVETGATDTAPADAPAGDAPDAPAAVALRVTIGGRGAKKDASGAVVTPAEPTVEVFKGTVDIAGVLSDPANAIAVRNLAANALIDALTRHLRSEAREPFAQAMAAGLEGDALAAAMPSFNDASIGAILSGILAAVPDPFAVKPKRAGAPKLKAQVADLTDRLGKINELAAGVAAALAEGDTAKAAELQNALLALTSQVQG